MARYFITGSTGYVGSHLMARLAGLPDTTVIGLSRKGAVREEGRLLFQGDLLLDNLEAVLSEARPDVIFHTVGINPLAPFEDQMRVHAEGTRRLLSAVGELPEKPVVVVTGSAAEYGLRSEPVSEEALTRPEGEYGICKLAQTHIALTYARRYEIPVRVARIFNVYGHTMPGLVVASLASQIAAGERKQSAGPAVIQAMNLESARDFVHVDDVVSAMLAMAALPLPDASRNEPWGEIFNVATGEATPIRKVFETLLSLSTLRDPQVEVRADQRPDMSRADIAKIGQRTGWAPAVSLVDGLKQELDYWRNRVEALV